MEELILGFDARVVGVRGLHRWDDKRKKYFLFRLDVSQPFSVDLMVWPSVFDDDGYDIPRPSYVGFYHPLWENLDELQQHVKLMKVSRLERCYIIAVILQYTVCDMQEKEAWRTLLTGFYPKGFQSKHVPTMSFSKPPVRYDTWKFLGYDISDGNCISGLSNCGVDSMNEDKQELISTWGPYLNTHHLFEDIDNAVSFKDFLNKRVKTHAPFFVFGLWLVEEIPGIG